MESYAATRIHVMRSKLIDAEEYERLIKMSDKEVIGFLQGTEYRKEVDALEIRDLEDLGAVDRILAANARRVTRKLERISGEEFTRVLQHVLEENDIWNVTVIAEAITGGNDPEEALERYERHGTFDARTLTDAKSVKELAERAATHLPHVRGATSFPELVHALSRKRHFTERYLIDEHNIRTLIQFKREDIPADEIMTHLIRGGSIGLGTFRDAAGQDLAGAIQMLKQTKYKEVFENIDPDDLTRFEDALHRFVVRKLRIHSRRKPFGSAILMNYLVEKDIEHENLRVLIKGKRLGLDESFIREHLIA